MKKGGFLRNVLDTIRSNQQAGGQQPGGGHSTGSSSAGSANSGPGADYAGLLRPQHLALAQVARHGFPEAPTALAFDPVQKIAAIGTRSGALRVFGRPGVDVWLQHKPEAAVTHIRFIINQGALITVTADESINLWSLRGPQLQLAFSGGANAGLSGAHSPTPVTSTGSATATASTELPDCSDYLSCDGLGEPTGAEPTGAGSTTGTPTLLHTLKFQRERITCLHQTLMSKWLYVGTERGNVHVANVETFELSGYSIPWNKAIELSRKTHPGAIISISECPQDTNKLLIGYESGCIVLWDLKNKSADGRYYHTEALLWLAWHHEGKQFMAAHGDGSLVTWHTRSNARPAQILHPHAKTQHQAASAQRPAAPSASSGFEQAGAEQFVSSGHQQQLPLAGPATSFARALNNELYRPINKVEWKTSKASNEQFLLFSGGLPYDHLADIEAPGDPMRQSLGAASPLQRLPGGGGGTQGVPSSGGAGGAPQTNQYLAAAAAASTGPSSPGFLASGSPMSPSLSPSNSQQYAPARSPTHQPSGAPAQLRDPRRNLRATSLTVMFGKSITVLEMDEAIVDFVSVCDNSPYENDTADPYAVLVLLSNDLILIDLTSSGYPSFESPYPASALTESPVTSIQYLADCSNDIIPMLYSSSRNVLSRAPKKGFSDKEWPINGGEWGQQMQSYPELVITGHADGTIKFWDMSGVNFDLISKIKTSKLFERPIRPPNHIIVEHQAYRKHRQQQQQSTTQGAANKRRAHTTIRSVSPAQPHHSATSDSLEEAEDAALQLPALALEDCFAIEKIEYCSESRHLLVAGALSQVIQFKLNKRDSSSPSGAGPQSGPAAAAAPGAPQHDLTSLLVEPCPSPTSASFNEQQANQSQHHRTHLLIKARSLNPQAAAAAAASTSSTSGGSSSSASGAALGAPSRSGASAAVAAATAAGAFQPDLICLTPLMLMSSVASEFERSPGAALSATDAAQFPTTAAASSTATNVYIAPPKVTALALKASHSILAYSHENGLVLIDNIQKCVVMNASLAELYGFGSLSNRCDISIQPFATSSILQQHYQSTTGSPLSSSTYALGANNPAPDEAGQRRPLSSSSAYAATTAANNNNDAADNGGFHQPAKSAISPGASDPEAHDNGPGGDGSIRAGSLHKSSGKSNGAAQARFAAGAFQRQLSTTALLSGPGSGGGPSASGSARAAPGLFQRQMTASQLLGGGQQPAARQAGSRAAFQTAGGRQAPHLAGSALCLNPATAEAGAGGELSGAARKPASKNKRIISRMLSISAIHTPSSSSSSPPSGGGVFESAGHGGGGECSDLSAPSAAPPDQQPAPDKIDSSFTRSRSSSASSTAPGAGPPGADQGPASNERPQCLCFLEAAPAAGGAHKSPVGQAAPIAGDSGQLLALWLGTSSGSLLLVGLQMPDTEDNRVLQLQSVQAEPIPQAATKLRGACLELAAFRAPSSSHQAHRPTPSGGSQSSSSVEGEPQPGGGGQLLEQQQHTTFLVAVSEKEARVYQVPPPPHHQHQASASSKSAPGATCFAADWPLANLLKAGPWARAQHSDSSFACQSALVWWRQPEEACLASYLATGELRVLSLPHLRPLLEADLVPYSHPRIAQQMRFSRNGHALYQPAPGQVAKFTLSAQYAALVPEMAGSVWVAREMPEQPRANFFRSLFSAAAGAGPAGARAQSGRDELFGTQAAGKALRGVATHISGLDKLKGSVASGFAGELRQAREGLDERGEKLGDLEDRTAQMAAQAEGYAQAAHQLAQKFKDRKWYHF